MKKWELLPFSVRFKEDANVRFSTDIEFFPHGLCL